MSEHDKLPKGSGQRRSDDELEITSRNRSAAERSAAASMLDAATSQLGDGLVQRKIARRIQGRLESLPAEGKAPGDAGERFAEATAGGASSLPFRAEMERSFGQDFSSVRSYLGRAEPLAGIEAEAAACGDRVAFASERPSRETVAHELTHVVQGRRAGGAEPVRARAEVSQPSDAAEVEAERVAAEVTAGRPAEVQGGAAGIAIHRLATRDELDPKGKGKSEHFEGLLRRLDRYHQAARAQLVGGDSEVRRDEADALLDRLGLVESAAESYLDKTKRGEDDERHVGVTKLIEDVAVERTAIDAVVDDVAWDEIFGRRWEHAITLHRYGARPDPGVGLVGTTKTGGKQKTDKVKRGKSGTRKGAKQEAKRGELADIVQESGLPADPDRAMTVIAARCPKGPPLSPAEYLALRQLTNFGDKGVSWLHAAGLYTSDEALDYLSESNYRDFHNLRPSQKVQLASAAYRHGKEGTPPYFMELSMRGRDPDRSKEKRDRYRERIEEMTTGMWAQTVGGGQMNEEAIRGIEKGGVMDPTGGKKSTLSVDGVAKRHGQATSILRKVFILLQAGLKKFDPEGDDYIDWQGPVAIALSHGGRVNVRIPKLKQGQRGTELTDWLGITQDGELPKDGAVFDRGFATHRIDIEKGKDGKRGKFKEKGGMGASIANKVKGDTKIWGMNMSVGGLGNRDFNGDVVLPDGAHGHMFIGFRPPTSELDGALQIGIETTGPHALSTVGYVHNWQSSEKTANPISSVGGLKQDKVGSTKNPNLVDLEGLTGDEDGDWQGHLEQLARQLEDVTPLELVGPRR